MKNKKVRCAIYTRKSTEEGLEQEFNSLDAQRESAQPYIAIRLLKALCQTVPGIELNRSNKSRGLVALTLQQIGQVARMMAEIRIHRHKIVVTIIDGISYRGDDRTPDKTKSPGPLDQLSKSVAVLCCTHRRCI